MLNIYKDRTSSLTSNKLHEKSKDTIRCSHKPKVAERHTMQLPKETGLSPEIQNITKKITHRATRTSLKTGYNLRCPGRVSSSCFICVTRRVALVANRIISQKYGKNRIMITKNGTYL